MIQKISLTENKLSFRHEAKAEKPAAPVKTKARLYTDSFLNNAVKSTPLLLSLSAVWSIIDYGTKKESLIKAFSNNLKWFFAPVLIVSSVIMALTENIKPKEKQEK